MPLPFGTPGTTTLIKEYVGRQTVESNLKHPKEKKGLSLTGITTPVQTEKHSLKWTVFTHNPGTIRLCAGIIPHLEYFLAKCTTNFEIKCAQCTSF